MSRDVEGMSIQEILAHEDFVRGLARRLVADANHADDLVQEAWVVAMRHPPSAGAGLGGWFSTVMRNLVRSGARADRRRRARDRSRPPPRAIPGPDEILDREFARERLVEAVVALRPVYRDVILLRFFEDLPPREIAGHLELPVTTVKTRLKRALAQLRHALDGTDERGQGAWSVALLSLAELPRESAVSGPPWSVMLGGLFMSSSMKVILGLAIVVVVGFAGWWFGSPGERVPVPGVASGEFETQEDTRGTAQEARVEPEPVTRTAAVPTVEFDRERDVFGTVRDAKGLAVAGARIEFRMPGGVEQWARGLGRAAREQRGPDTHTGADGSFCLRLKPDQRGLLDVSAEAHGSRTWGWCRAGERVEIVLSPLATLRVSVRFDDDTPAEALQVLVTREAWGTPRIGTTDATGACDLGVPSGTAWLRLEMSPATVHLERIELAAGETLEKSVVLRRPWFLEGRVEDALRRLPVSDALVSSNREFQEPVATDRAGEFEILVPPSEFRRLQLSPDLHVQAEGYAYRGVPAAADSVVVIPLVPEARIHGRILGVDGRPVAGAVVLAYGHAMGNIQVPGHDDVSGTEADENGEFQLTGLPDDVPYAVCVRHQDRYGAHLVVEPTRLARGEVLDLGDVHLVETRVVRGRAVDGAGDPLRRKSISLDSSSRTQVSRFFAGQQATSDDLGRFSFVGVLPGDYAIQLREQDFGTITELIEVVAEQDLEGVLLERAAGSDLRLHLVDLDGQDAARIGVSIAGSFGERHGRTDDRGRVVFRGLPDSPFRLGFRGGQFVAPDESFRVPAEGELQVSLTPKVRIEWGRLEGQVLDSSGRPVPRMRIYVKREGAPDSHWGTWDATDEGGAFSFERPRGVTFEIRITGQRNSLRRDARGQVVVEASRYFSDSQRVQVPAEGIRIVARERVLDGTLHVRLLDRSGEPIPDWRVGVESIHGPAVSLETDDEGWVRFEGLPRDRVRVFAYKQHDPDPRNLAANFAGRRVTVDDQEVTLQFRPTVPWHGEVVDAAARGIATARVWVTAEDGETRAGVTTDEAGHFVIHVHPGEVYTAHAYFQEARGVSHEREFPGVQAESGPLRLRLESLVVGER